MHGHFRHTPTVRNLSIVWVLSFIETDVFDNSVQFDNYTTLIYLINLLWNNENEHLNVCEFHTR